MINKQNLHDLMRKNLDDYSTSAEYLNDRSAPRHMAIMAQTMQKYFEDNTEITYAWSAVNSNGSPDSTTSFVSTVTFSPWNLDSPMNLPGLAAKIMAATATGVINHPAAFSVPAGAFLIKPLTLPQNSDPAQCLMKCIAEPVCDWIKTLINPAPLSGAHTAYSGAATMSAIN